MKNIKTIILVIIILAIAAFVITKITGKSGSKEPKTSGSFKSLIGNLEGYIIKTSRLNQDIEVSGTIEPFDETVLMSEVSGRVVQLNLPEGKNVKKGTLLVKLFDDDLQAQLKMLKVQLKIAENNEERLKSLYDIKGTSQQEYDNSVLQVSNIRAQIEVMTVNIGKTEIRAPYDGTIGLKKISIGQYITPIIQIATIRAVNSLKLDFSVPEQYSQIIRDGSVINFTASGSDRIFQAKVIATESNIESDSRNLNVRAMVIGNTQGLIPGIFAKVKASLGTKENAIMIPTAAIVPQASQKKVFVLKDGIAKSVILKTGVREANGIEVISGLQPGDTIITTGVLFVKPNSKVKLSKVY